MWLLVLLAACERPPRVDVSVTPEVPPAPEYVEEPVVEPEVVAPQPSYVAVDWQPPACTPWVEEPFNTANIDPVYDATTETPWGALTDGLVRVRFDVTLPMDNVLTLRDGFTVAFDGGSVRVANGAKQPIYKVENVKHIELVVWLLGPTAVVEVHDADSGLELLTVKAVNIAMAASVPTWTGVSASLASMRVACTPMPVREGVNPLPRYLKSQAPVSGAERVESLPDGDVYQTTSRGLEAAYCAGVTLDDVWVEPPWRVLDDEFRTWSQSPPAEVDGRLRFDLSYKSAEMVSALLHEVHRRFPEMTRLETVGYTSQGRPIEALVVAKNLVADDPRPAILINGAYHGDEILSSEVVLGILEETLYADNDATQQALERYVQWFVPVVNGDGVNEFLNRSQFSGRKNARDLNGDGRVEKREGVDLNRNFPIQWGTLEHEELSEPFGKWYRGPEPASEAETQAMMALVDRERFVMALSYHTGTTAVLSGYSIDTLQNASPDESVAVGKVVAKAMGKAPNGRTFRFRKNLYAVEGVDQDWMRFTHGTIAILVEASRGSPAGWCARTQAVQPGVRAWRAALGELNTQRLISGKVIGHDGAPRSVEVKVVGQTLRNHEVWTSRPRDGRFWRLVPKDRGAFVVGGKSVPFVAGQTVEVVLD
ncbi:MAG: M14 family metallopeptidase [bacterium]